MKQCQYCGAPIPSGANYCYNCKQQTQGVTPPPIIAIYKRRRFYKKVCEFLAYSIITPLIFCMLIGVSYLILRFAPPPLMNIIFECIKPILYIDWLLFYGDHIFRTTIIIALIGMLVYLQRISKMIAKSANNKN
jgi:FtsH-binding integral membrane protein